VIFMSIFEKLGFKKKEDLSDDSSDLEPSGGGMGAMPPLRKPSVPDFSSEPGTAPFDMPRPSSFQQQDSRGMDLVNAKLDTIKAVLDSINARLEHLERMAASASEEAKIPRWR
jgi:hypothetical protein